MGCLGQIGHITAVLLRSAVSSSGSNVQSSALCCSSRYGQITGVMKVNGVRRTLSEFRDVCGFVPQDDIMHTDLKVRELLTQPHANLVIY